MEAVLYAAIFYGLGTKVFTLRDRVRVPVAVHMTIAFDVDGTLIGQTFVDENVPKYKTLDLLRWFLDNGDTVYVWSGGGVDYAKRWAEKLGLDERCKVIAKGSIPVDIAVDDEFVQLGKVNIKIKTVYKKL